MKPNSTSNSEQKNIKLIRSGLIGLITGLVVQFTIGMYLNFYAEMPDTHPGTNGSFAPSIPWALAGHAGVALMLHVIIWILLTLGAIVLVVRAAISKRRAYIVGTSLGLLCILMAGSGGLNFLNRGGEDAESFMMALGFILALVAYGVTLYKTPAANR
jgi:uncharacterized membrane protein